MENADPAWIAQIEEQIARRAQAKREKDFATADAIRASLLEQGVLLEDTPTGTTYKLKR